MIRIYEETGFDQIIAEIKGNIISDFAKKDFDNRRPTNNLQTAQKRLTETKEAMVLLSSGQHVPFMGMRTIEHLTSKIERGMVLEAGELTEYSDFLRSFRLIKQLFEKNQYQTPTLHRYTAGLGDFTEVCEAITQAINGAHVKDESSRGLRKVRSRIHKLESGINQALEKHLKNPTTAKYLQDRLVIEKEGRQTLPVKTEFQSKINGTIIERSSRGTTVFIEPTAVSKNNDALILARGEETGEIYQILAGLTGLIADKLTEIGYSREIIGELDIIFARAKYSRRIEGKPVAINDQEVLHLDHLYHPLLGSQAVPLTVSLGEKSRGLIITGPNAGGKTLVLKTVALACLCAASGILLKHGGNSQVPILQDIFIDIGDQQNLDNALSTFSAHMDNVAKILRQTKPASLVLLDEIGSGTEPKEGAALGIAIMEELYLKGALVIATTHYGEIKDFALAHPDFRTAAMAFDEVNLKPKYQLLMDQVGASNAFWIAKEKALPESVLQRAQGYLAGEAYELQQVQLKMRKMTSATVAKSTESQNESTPIFAKGDRVLLTETKEKALFYEELEQEMARVYLDKTFREVPLRRLKLVTAATVLYPADYDLESLFTDFHERKFQKDIDRGSKKAQKKLRKQAEARKNQ
ncbi:endonuclease MutS2 [Enterococcus asini]|uniref:endonuclease MutS2 n=1 Tax=Enterococcus asini TaxID=57732 RepID=UPI00289122AD|nr:endonuclease MutS2 [Enterococcus asini]MDT2757773.1 endonuclease MutS2 [Enterococcus asini]